MIIKRDRYLENLIRARHNGLCKVVTGIRRCGKTFLLCRLFYDYLVSDGVDEDHIIKIAMDDRRNKALRDPDTLLEHVYSSIKDKNMYYLIIDEVQMVEDFADVLSSFLHSDNIDVYVSGSNARFLSKDIVTEFRGRASQIHIAPLCFKEIYEASASRSKEEVWADYVLYGGMPKILEFEKREDKAQYLQQLYQETFLRDIVERNKIKKEEDLEELLFVLASTIGSLQSIDKITNTFNSVKHRNMSPNTIRKYIDHIADSFLVENVRRYDIKGRSYINSPSKYYFADLGLRNASLNFRQVEETHILENIIFNELFCLGYSVDVGAVKAYQKNDEGKSVLKNLEVDFVCNNLDKRIYIQVALSLPDEKKWEQESLSLKKIEDSFKKIIITKDAISTHYNEEGILIVNLFDFLLDPEVLMR